MIEGLRLLRGTLSLIAVLSWLAAVALPTLGLLGIALSGASARTRLAWMTRWVRAHCRVLMGFFRAGGARFERHGAVPTDAPGIVVMNHQSLLDIPTAVLMCSPVVPAFVARERYARVPLIGTAIRMADCPIVTPGVDREATLAGLGEAVAAARAVLVYPEGHRTCDGRLQPFRTAGLLAMLRRRRVPVWVIATDGFWIGRRLVDLVRIHRIRGVTRVVACLEPPAEDDALPGFLAEVERVLANALDEMRR